MILIIQLFHLLSFIIEKIEINNEILFRHLIFEYLPYEKNKKPKQTSSPISINKEKEESLSTSTSDNSAIDKLLGRLPIWSSSPPSPSSSTLPLNDAGLELLNLLQQQSKKESSKLDHIETNRNPMSIVDRLNEAIHQAQCNNNPNSTNNPDHRIAVHI
jgi:hypothetical protein